MQTQCCCTHSEKRAGAAGLNTGCRHSFTFRKKRRDERRGKKWRRRRRSTRTWRKRMRRWRRQRRTRKKNRGWRKRRKKEGHLDEKEEELEEGD